MFKINEFAFCFFATNQDDIDRQQEELVKLDGKYQIERWYRLERNQGMYPSFAQMTNDAIDDTESEFMLFCNPKTNFVAEDLEFLINKLASGYCFAAKVGFGLFGFSKELIRHIGMMDERFIGGEYEDDDFAIRLRHFGKAAWLEYDRTQYAQVFSRSKNLKHITTSIFGQKYSIEGNTVLIDTNFFTHKNITRRHKLNDRPDILNSWLDHTHNHGDCKISKWLTNYTTEFISPKIEERVVNFEFKIERSSKDFKAYLTADDNINLYFTIVSNLEMGRKYMWNHMMHSVPFKTYWRKFEVYSEDDVEIRIFLDDNQIYNNTIKKEVNLTLDFTLPVQIKIK